VLEQEELDRHKLGRKIVMEEDWLRYGVTARRKRNQKRLADLHALRKKRKELRGAVANVKLRAADAELSGRLVAVAENVTKGFGDRVVVRDFSTRILRGDRVGIAGPNGAGKTTLLNMLTGTLEPDAGSVTIGTNLAQVSVDQRRDVLDPDRTLTQTLTGGAGDSVTVAGQTRHVIGYMKDFLFAPEQANTPVGVLSGGERARLTLALAFAKPSNLLVLDEPTNDLDLETLELLQERLADYPGTVLLVSHDRDFIDRVVTSLIATEGDGQWTEYAGGYSDMLAQRGPLKATATATIARPKAEAQPRAVGTKRMTFKDRHALETLPARIAALQADFAKLTAALEDPDLYTRNQARFAETTAALEAARQNLAAAEEQWLQLEMLREELEG
jgi:ATP-binding cassette subfamily F protein uup